MAASSPARPVPGTGNARSFRVWKTWRRSSITSFITRGELGVELAEERRRHGAEHARIRHGRPGAEQDARGRQEIADQIDHGLSP